MPYIPKRYTQITGVFKIWAAPQTGITSRKRTGSTAFSPNTYNRSFSILRSSTSNTDNTQSTWMYHKIPTPDKTMIRYPTAFGTFSHDWSNTWLNAMLKYPCIHQNTNRPIVEGTRSFLVLPTRNSRSVCPSR